MENVIEFICRVFFLALFSVGFSAVFFIIFRKMKKILLKQLGISLAVVSAVLLCLSGYFCMDIIKKDTVDDTLSYSHFTYRRAGYCYEYFEKNDEEIKCRTMNSQHNQLNLEKGEKYMITYAKRTKIIISAEKLKG